MFDVSHYQTEMKKGEGVDKTLNLNPDCGGVFSKATLDSREKMFFSNLLNSFFDNFILLYNAF